VIVMAIIGGALITLLMGKIALTNLAVSYAVPGGCFVIIALYAWFGSAAAPEELAQAEAAASE
jgi:fucose permease